MSGLAISGISKSFGERRVLDEIDLDIAAGSVVAVLGPSGGGKTTLLRIIAGFLDADSGSIDLAGSRLVDNGRGIPPQHRRIGYVPQEGALFPHLDVAANIAFGIRGAARRSFDVDGLLALVDLDPSLKRRHPHELSGGQQQRVALARALAPEPGVVLLDEPFSSLDAALRAETGAAVIGAIRATGATAVLVTHDQDEALALADRVAVLRDGRVAQYATPVDLYRSPVDAATAAFVGRVVVLRGVVDGDTATTAVGRFAVAPGSPQGAVQVLLRPEQLSLAPDGTGPTARVLDVSYYGHDATVRLMLEAGGDTIEARVLGGDLPTRGDVVALDVRGPVTVVAPGGAA
jgi:iron(III) transport system ATP-binding protein